MVALRYELLPANTDQAPSGFPQDYPQASQVIRMHLLSNCARFTQRPVGGLWISVGPRHRRIEGVGLSSMPREFPQHSNRCKLLSPFDLGGFTLYPQMRRRRRFIYIRLQRNSLPVVAGQTRRNVVFGRARITCPRAGIASDSSVWRWRKKPRAARCADWHSRAGSQPSP